MRYSVALYWVPKYQQHRIRILRYSGGYIYTTYIYLPRGIDVLYFLFLFVKKWKDAFGEIRNEAVKTFLLGIFVIFGTFAFLSILAVPVILILAAAGQIQ